MPPTVALAPDTIDSRMSAYCSPDGPEVFSGIVHGNQIWIPDPFDVEAVHPEARNAFHRLLTRASGVELPPHGKSLLLLGEGGSGKTHLMRAFRTATHADGSGYCGYLQMTSRTDNYARYVLSNLIDSLEQPYRPSDPTTGLARLARGLIDALEMLPEGDRCRLCNDLLEPDEVTRLVFRFADVAVQDQRFARIDINLLRAILFLLADDGRIRPKIVNWLRCEDLPAYDREVLGGLVPRSGPEMPLKMIVGLGHLIRTVQSGALVLLVDQMEEMIELARGDALPGELFRTAINALIDIADALPNAVIVIGCLSELYDQHGRPAMPRPKLDRLETDQPIRLASNRSEAEVWAILARRLEVFFDAVGVESEPSNLISPYSASHLSKLAGMRTRDVLDHFRKHRADCISAKRWVEPAGAMPPKVPVPATDYSQKWADFLAAAKPPIVDEPKLAELLAWAIDALSAEMSHGLTFGTDPDGRFVSVDIQSGNEVTKLLVVICDKSGKGGGLSRQIEEVVKRAGEIPAVFLRSTEFPKTPTADITKQLAKLCIPVGRHRKTVVANSDWRAMLALREFEQKHHKEPSFAAWRKEARLLAALPALRQILSLEKLEAAGPAKPLPPSPPLPPVGVAKPAHTPTTPAPAPSASLPKTMNAGIRVGHTRSAAPAVVEFDAKVFCRHAAFLGGSGSGKTTAALAIIEQLLLVGVPVVMLDRKGDLARYADPLAWKVPESDASHRNLRDRLSASTDVVLYTPGADRGRPLAIPVVPSDLASASTADREQIAQFAATGLAMMMGYKSKTADPRLVILQKAIEALATAPGQTVTVKTLQKLVAEQDPCLMTHFDGQYEDRYFRSLATDLLTLSLRHRRLLEGTESLNIDTLLGRGSGGVSGKTRLAVINTQFLGDTATTDFWVSQFLVALDRWRAKNPALDGVLQAVFLFDEADQYLPATARPATKGPMESLLKRARSAGIGLFLATQSPGDLDYRCRDQVLTWFIGRVKEPVAISKLKPMLDAKPGAADKLAEQKAGEFYLVQESDMNAIRTERNFIATEQLSEERILEIAQLK